MSFWYGKFSNILWVSCEICCEKYHLFKEVNRYVLGGMDSSIRPLSNNRTEMAGTRQLCSKQNEKLKIHKYPALVWKFWQVP